MPPHDLISSIFSSSLFLYPFFWSDKSIKLQFCTDFDQPKKKKKKNPNNRTRLQHTAPLVCSWLSWVPLDETFWRVQVRIVTTVFSGSAEAFEALKRRVSPCFLVLLTSDVFAKKNGAGLLTLAPASFSAFAPPSTPLTMYMLYSYTLHDEIVHTWMCLLLHFAVRAQLQSEQTSTE